MKVSAYICGAMFAFLGCTTSHPEARLEDQWIHMPSNQDHASLLNKGDSLESVDSTILTIKEDLVLKKSEVPRMLDLADLYLAKNDYKSSEYWVRKALRYDMKNKRARLILAGVFYRQNMLDMSSMLLEVLGGEDSTNSSVLNLMAMIEVKKDNPDRGMFLFSKALDVDPDNISTRMNMGVQYFRYRRLSEAAIQFERVLKVVPDHRDAHLHLAMIHASKGRKEKALEALEDVLSEDSENSVALYNRASLYASMKDYDDALDDLRDLLNSEDQKSDRTAAAFKMITRLNTLIKDRDEKMSYAEINSLASSLRDGGSPKKVAKKQKVRTEPKVQQKPQRKLKQKKQAKKVDELEELEKELLGEGL